MSPTRRTESGSPPESRYVRWLRVAKLLLTVVLLALAIWQAVVGGATVPLP